MTSKAANSTSTEGGAIVVHRDDEYDPSGFAILEDMQERHFWYRGRHRFLLSSLSRHIGGYSSPRVIDLGGGCGGWLAYLARSKWFPKGELALADSSPQALELAARVLPSGTQRFHIDLLNQPWTDRWDVAFLLDVLEHIPAHEEALRQAHKALTPGGLLFITTPALRVFWSWNDEVVHHIRRYSKSDFKRLAAASGFRLLESRYFMFFLSPLLLATRLVARSALKDMSQEQVQEMVKRMHRVPGRVLNGFSEQSSLARRRSATIFLSLGVPQSSPYSKNRSTPEPSRLFKLLNASRLESFKLGLAGQFLKQLSNQMIYMQYRTDAARSCKA